MLPRIYMTRTGLPDREGQKDIDLLTELGYGNKAGTVTQ